MKKIIFKIFLISLFTALCFFGIDKVYAYTSGVSLYYGTSNDRVSLNQGSAFGLSSNKEMYIYFNYNVNYVSSYSNMYQLYIRQTFCSVNGLETDDYSNVSIVNTKVRCQRSEGNYGYLSFVLLNLNNASYFEPFVDEENKIITYAVNRHYTLKSTTSNYDYAVLYGMEVSPDFSSFPTYDDSSSILDKLDSLNSQLSALKSSSDEQVYYLKKIYDLFKCEEVNLFNKDDDTNKIDGFINGTTKKLVKYNVTKSAYVNILPNTTYTVTKTKGTRFIIGTSSSLDFNTTFTNIVDGNGGAKQDLTITSGSNDKYLVVFYYNSGSDTLSAEEIADTIQVEKGNVATSYLPYGQCRSMMDTIKDSASKSARNSEEIKKSLSDDDTSESTSTAGDFFSGFTTDTHGLTSIITAPLTLIGSITSSSCSPLGLKVPFVKDKTFNLPCMSTIYKKHFGSFMTIYQTITFGIVSYWVCVRIFALVKDFKNPEKDEVEVMDL